MITGEAYHTTMWVDSMLFLQLSLGRLRRSGPCGAANGMNGGQGVASTAVAVVRVRPNWDEPSEPVISAYARSAMAELEAVRCGWPVVGGATSWLP